VKRVILTADDFGYSVPGGEGVEEAQRDGRLRRASLRVAGEAAEGAARLASCLVGRQGTAAIVRREGNWPHGSACALY